MISFFHFLSFFFFFSDIPIQFPIIFTGWLADEQSGSKDKGLFFFFLLSSIPSHSFFFFFFSFFFLSSCFPSCKPPMPGAREALLLWGMELHGQDNYQMT